jgi:hypothetical protein
MNTYRVTGPRPVCDVDPGGELEHEFSAEEEADLLDSGRLELVPRRYRVVGTSRVCETEPGKEFDGVFRIPHERALLDVHIERVQRKPAQSDPAKRGTKKE